jgi:hypothetical protein
MDDEKPSTKHLVLKAKEIVPTDSIARPGDGQTISVQLIHRENQLAEEKAAARRRTQAPFPASPGASEPPLPPVFKPKEIVPIDPPAHANEEEAIRVPSILLENQIAEEEAGWARIFLRKRRKISKRTRDFLLLVGPMDLAVVLFVRWSLNGVSLIFGISAVTLLTSSVAWIMFVVMDEY